jgi:hypothetical protein
LKRNVKAFKRARHSGAARRLNDLPPVASIEGGELVVRMPSRFDGYMLRGRWFKDDRYASLRNAAWVLRNSRAGQMLNPAALTLVVHEGKKLTSSGEDLADVLEAFAELLIHP